MVKTASCPTKEDLIRLNHGDLPGDQLESVCDHVEACEKCQLILGQLDEPPNEFGKQLAHITPDDLENARVAIEAETLKDRATTIWGQHASIHPSKDREPTLSVPCNLRQYEVLRLIGYGGMGEVYEGRHSNLKRPVALKVIQGLRQDDPVAYEHFLQEMETAGQLEHPNLVRAYDAWEHDGCLFLAQELLEGDSLQQLASKGLIKTPAEIVDALLGTCRALEQLHAKGFVHRDVKPGNIMRLTDGTIKLIDYGLAIAAESGKSAARVGAGTIGYMSPEQAHGTGPVDHRSDIYSTGRVLKYLLSKLPTDTDDAKHTELIEKLSELADRLTQKDPQKRLQSVYAVVVKLEQLQQSVEQISETPVLPPPSVSIPPSTPTASPPAAKRSKREATARQKKPAAPTVTAKREPKAKRRGTGWLVFVALLLGMGGFGAYQLIFKTDRQATITVENHQAGDVIQITSQDGKVRSVELGDQAKFVVDPGRYELALEGSGDRRLNPANITVTGRDQLTLRIEDAIKPIVQAPSAGESNEQGSQQSEDVVSDSGMSKEAVLSPKEPSDSASNSAQTTSEIAGRWYFANFQNTFHAELDIHPNGSVVWKDLTNRITLNKYWSRLNETTFLISDQSGVKGQTGWITIHFPLKNGFGVCDSWGAKAKATTAMWPAPTPARSMIPNSSSPIIGHWLYRSKKGNFFAQLDAREDGTVYWLDKNGVAIKKHWKFLDSNTCLISDEPGVRGSKGWHIVHFPGRNGILQCDDWGGGTSAATLSRGNLP